MKRIVYLGYYDTLNGGTDVVLSATNKMDYIIDSLVEIGLRVDIVSPSILKKRSWERGSYKRIGENVFLKKFSSFFAGTRFGCVLTRRIVYKELEKYLNKELRTGDTLLVYHSLGYLKLPQKLKRKKNIKLIYEVEEIYSDVGNTKITREEELLAFKEADAFLVPAKSLNNTVNENGKPTVFIHGVYKVEKKCAEKFDDGRIHCVYAGTFDKTKGGALAAIQAAEFLNEKYCLHILGFGGEQDICLVRSEIEKIKTISKCDIVYHGLLKGEEYTAFLQKCHIGLSTQAPSGIYNETSFPSKILSYLSNGLLVVTVNIPVVKESSIGNIVYYYEEQTAKSIASAIMQAANNVQDNARNVLDALDDKFKADLQELINNLKENIDG